MMSISSGSRRFPFESDPSFQDEYEVIDRIVVGDDRNKTLFNWAPLAIVILNSQGILLDSNMRLFEWLGYKPEEVIGKNILSLPFLPPQTKTTLFKNFNLRLLGHRLPSYEVIFIHKNGEVKWGEVYGTLVRDEHAHIDLDLVMVVDITEKKKALGTVKESEARYRGLFEHANDLIQSVDAEGRFVEVNPKWLSVLGYTREEVDHLCLKDILRRDQVSHCLDLFSRVVHGERFEHVETVFISKTGAEVVVEGSIGAQFQDGVFVATVGIFRLKK